jgi:hypothetical protein
LNKFVEKEMKRFDFHVVF